VVRGDISCLGQGEDRLVKIGVELLSDGFKLDDVEALEAGVHHLGGHAHALGNLVELTLELLDIFLLIDLDLLDVSCGHL
jgi:hypothetical protein